MNRLGTATIFIHILTTLFSVYWSRRREHKQDTKLYIALMVGGFVWSQLQTEYLILRINKHTEKTVHKYQKQTYIPD